MDLQISGRHMEVTEAMTDRVNKNAQKLPRFDEGLMALKVTLSADKGDEYAELIAKARHTTFVAKSNGESLYECIDSAFKKLESQIVRHCDKVKHHRGAKAEE